MKYSMIVVALVLGACETPKQIDVTELKRPKAWVLQQHAKIEDLKDPGEELFERFDTCRLDQNTLVDKHAIASRWISNVAPPEPKD